MFLYSRPLDSAFLSLRFPVLCPLPAGSTLQCCTVWPLERGASGSTGTTDDSTTRLQSFSGQILEEGHLSKLRGEAISGYPHTSRTLFSGHSNMTQVPVCAGSKHPMAAETALKAHSLPRRQAFRPPDPTPVPDSAMLTRLHLETSLPHCQSFAQACLRQVSP